MKQISLRILTLFLLLCMLLPSAMGCTGDKSPKATVGENGNWFLNGTDTGMPATGPSGIKITVGENGNWFIDDKDCGIKAEVKDGSDLRVTVGANGNWFIDGTDTCLPSGRPVEGVVLRFAVASDVHFSDTPTVRDELLQKMYEQAYAYSQAQPDHKALDGVFFAGDIADTGSALSFQRFFEAVKTHTKPGTISLAAMGNHEFFDTASAVQDFIQAAGYDSADHHITIGPYHFILLSPDGGGTGFSIAKQQWLEAELEKAAATDPTGKRPIFVFQHHHVKDTVYGSAETWGLTDLRNVLNKYPQVVDFSGHSHFPINDPRSIWQGEFTALNTASLKGLELDLVGVQNDNIFPTDEEGGWSNTPAGRSDGGQYYIVEVTDKNEIFFRAFDIRTGMMVGELYLPSVGDPADFVYTNARKDTEAMPTFPEGAVPEQMTLRSNRAKFLIPQAQGAFVQHYRCEIHVNGNRYATSRRLSCSFLFPTPDSFTLPLSGLQPGKEYTIKVYPVTAWGNEGEPLVFSFTTPTSDITRGELLFGAAFAEGNKAIDTVTDSVLSKSGKPKTVYDKTLGRYVAEFDGNSAFMFYDFNECYAYMKQSMTLETYVKLGALPASDYVDIFSNQASGGLGFELTADGKLQIFVCIDGAYKNVTVTPAVIGEWMHLAATYDGHEIIFYINGVEVGRTAANGSITPPDDPQLVLGADSEGGSSGKHAVCTIAAANVYGVAYDAETIASMAAAYLNE